VKVKVKDGGDEEQWVGEGKAGAKRGEGKGEGVEGGRRKSGVQ
jgi:hypothetical protein